MPNKRWVAGAATLSWIDPKTGLPEVDKGGDPGPEITRQQIRGLKLYRFSNLLEAFIELDAKGAVTKAGFTDASGMYRGPSAFGFESAPVGKIGRSVATARASATFRQLVGCRTVSPERVGEIGGAVAGAATGAAALAPGGPVAMFIGAVALGTVGYFTGREVAELVSAFPPIWTEIELTIHSDGRLYPALVSHSVFPSNTFYAHPMARNAAVDRDLYDRLGSSYDGGGPQLKQWKKNGWGLTTGARGGATDGNPWGLTDPGKEIGRSSLPREYPLGYSH